MIDMNDYLLRDKSTAAVNDLGENNSLPKIVAAVMGDGVRAFEVEKRADQRPDVQKEKDEVKGNTRDIAPRMQDRRRRYRYQAAKSRESIPSADAKPGALFR